jgi:C4-dicarboxylate-specific signal transduction histidine kinase
MQEVFSRHIAQITQTSKVKNYSLTICSTLEGADNVIQQKNIEIIILHNNTSTSYLSDINFIQQYYGALLPIIVLTGIEDNQRGDEAIANGAQDYLSKGDITPKKIQLTVDRAIERANKQQEIEELRLQQAQLLKMATLGDMASNIAHEINGPLTVLSSYGMNLIKKCESMPPEHIKREGKGILKVIDRINKTITTLRNFARGDGDAPFELVSLKKIIDDTLVICQEKIKIDNIELEIEPFDDIELYCNDVQISQVLLNLIQNARDAIVNNETKWIHIKVISDSFRAIITVQDSGKSPDKATKRKMFRQYYTTKEKGKGTGLGLSISKRIIEGHKGKLMILDSENTTFEIQLPMNKEF